MVLGITIIVLLTAICYGWYVALIGRRNKALEALSSIDVQLRKRHDLVPNVLKLAERYMTYERDLLSRVTGLRNDAQKPYDPAKKDAVQQHLEAESGLQTGLRQLFALAENYPDLKASNAIIEAQQTFNEVEGHIAAARRFYNAAVASLNNAAQIFPGPLIASMANVETLPFFEIEDEAVRQPIDANDFLGKAEA